MLRLQIVSKWAKSAMTGQLGSYKLRRPRRACKRSWAATVKHTSGSWSVGGTGLRLDPVERARARQSLGSERGALKLCR